MLSLETTSQHDHCLEIAFVQSSKVRSLYFKTQFGTIPNNQTKFKPILGDTSLTKNQSQITCLFNTHSTLVQYAFFMHSLKVDTHSYEIFFWTLTHSFDIFMNLYWFYSLICLIIKSIIYWSNLNKILVNLISWHELLIA